MINHWDIKFSSLTSNLQFLFMTIATPAHLSILIVSSTDNNPSLVFFDISSKVDLGVPASAWYLKVKQKPHGENASSTVL